jgi:hypothetical protein
MFRMTNPAPNLIEEDDDDAPAWARRHLGMLVEIGDMGMVLARNLVRRVTFETEAAEAAAPDAPPPGRGSAIDPALSFTRISRAVRLTIALEARMRRDIEAGVFGPANDDGPGRGDDNDDDASLGPIDYEAIRQAIAAPIDHGAIKRSKDHDIRRAVEETIEATYDDPDEVERLTDALTERLEEDEFFEGRFQWPISETIAMICQDLGLDPDWGRWEKRRWARHEAETSPRGSPYATYVHQPLLPNQHPRPPMEKYRRIRGLPPLDGTPPPRAAPGPP